MRTNTFVLLLSALSFALVAPVCGGGSTDGDGDADADADADGDIDVDGDSDGDADGDLDAHGDADTDGDLDSDLPADADGCVPNTNECGPDGCGGERGGCDAGELCSEGTCLELTATFLATFEGGDTSADVGSESIDSRNGGAMAVVDNPFPSESNDSDHVLRVEVPPGSSVRAEYQSQRLETEGKTYFYVWRQHFEPDFLVGADVSWLVFAQWKTWPCGEYDGGFGDVICSGGGIFNDIELQDGSLFEVRFRAEPDCNFITTTISTDEVWDTYVLEIFWTNSSDGYYRLFRNDRLMEEQHDVKTLFDGFPADTGECDMYWSLGLYSTWADVGSSSLVRYIDDMAIYDADDGIELPHVCPGCGAE